MEPMEYVLGAGIVLFTIYGLTRIAMAYYFPKDS
jgi:hypothetical protein